MSFRPDPSRSYRTGDWRQARLARPPFNLPSEPIQRLAMAAETKATLEIAELETQRLPLSQVSPHPDNPRIHSPEQIEALKRSLELDGYIAGSMGVQRSTKTLYKGHGVYEALLALGCVEADFVVKDLTDAETLALLSRDNALSDMSTNDPIKLKAISVNLQEISVPIERMGYALKEIDAMLPKANDQVRTPGKAEQVIYEIAISLDSEDKQQALYKQLSDAGHQCRLVAGLRRSGNKAAQRMIPRLEKCSMCDKTTGLQRHHKDGNTFNNNADNIAVLCRKHHNEESTKMRAKAGKAAHVC